jgi:hypothetical protein
MVLWILVMLHIPQHYNLTIQELCEGSCSIHVTSQSQFPKYLVLTVFF